MEVVAGGAAAAVLVLVYVFESGSDIPAREPIKMPPGSYSFIRLRDTVVPLLAGRVESTKYQLLKGRWLVLPKPLMPDSDPVLAADGIFRPLDEGERGVDGSKCIVVDLRGRVTAGAGAAVVGVTAAAGAAVAGVGAHVGAARSVTVFAEQTFQAEATVALQRILKNVCPWFAKPSELQYRDLDYLGTSRDADIFTYFSETSQGQCQSVPSEGLRVVTAAPALRAAPPIPEAAGQDFSPDDASCTGPQKYFLAEAYSGENDETREDKLQQLETRMAFTQRRYEDRTGRTIADITSIIGVAGLVLAAGAKRREVALRAASKLVTKHAGPLARRLMQAGRFFVMVLEKAQMPTTVFQRMMGSTIVATAATVEATATEMKALRSELGTLFRALSTAHRQPNQLAP